MPINAWERFQLGEELADVRAEILTSWRRSQLSGVDPEVIGLPFNRSVPDSPFAASAQPVVDHVAAMLVGSDTCVALTDPAGQIIYRWVSDKSLQRDLDDLEVAEGFFFDEGHAGTNGVGTSLESRQVVTVRGDEHFKKPFHGYTCSAAPVHHPLTRRPVGAVNITCRVESTSPLLAPTVQALVREVEAAILESSGARQRRLFDEFTRARARNGAPVVTISPDVMMLNDAAAGFGLDHRELWRRVVDADGERLLELDGRTAVVRTISHGTQVVGAVLTFGPSRRHQSRPRDPQEIGAAAANRRDVIAAVVATLDRGEVVVLRGEPGTGKKALLEEVLANRGPAPGVVDCASLAHLGAVALRRRVQDWLSTDRPLLVLHLDRLSAGDVDILAGLLQVRRPGRDVLATVEDPPVAFPAEVVDLPPLRDRGGDVPGMARELAGDEVRWDAEVLDLLRRHDWPGNLIELEGVVRHAVLAAAGGVVGRDHLPAGLRVGSRRRLSVIERAQATAIADAMAAAGGNKAEAARRLGISRPTLYAKLKAYQF